MKKFVLFLSLALMIASCDDKDPDIIETPGDSEDPGIVEDPSIEETVADLSAEEMANCYIVQNAGKYKFKADNQFNLGEGLPKPNKITPSQVALVWQTNKNSVKSVELVFEDKTPYVRFEIEEASGNAVIAVENKAGEIEWSWHIWMPEEMPQGVETSTGYEVMNMNLGALNNNPGDVASYGMLYQWGRKDPLPASATLTGDVNTMSAPMYDINGNSVMITNSDWSNLDNNTLEYSISHPTVCLSNMAQSSISRDWLKQGSSNESLWGNPEGDIKDEENNYINKGQKTCYDPSPAGWRVAPADVFSDFTSSGGYAWDFVDFNIMDYNNDHILDIEDYDYGWHFYVNNQTALYFPAASRFDGSYAMLMGSMSGYWGNYWSNSPSSTLTGGALAVLAFQVKDLNGNDMVTVSPAAIGSKADAYSIRCIKDPH